MNKLFVFIFTFSFLRRWWVVALLFLAGDALSQGGGKPKIYTGVQTTYNNLVRYGSGAPTFNPSGSVYDTLAFSYIDTSQNTHPITYEWGKTKWFVTSQLRQPSPPLPVATVPNPDIDNTMAVWVDTDDAENKYYYDQAQAAWKPIGEYLSASAPNDIAATGSTGAVNYRRALWLDSAVSRLKAWNGSAWVDVTAGDNWGSQVASVNARLTGNGSSGSPLDLGFSGVTPGSFTLMNATVDVYGRITTASNGTVNLSSQVTSTLLTINGGTGLSTYSAGDMLFYSSGTALSKLAIGTANQLLRVNGAGTAPEWWTPNFLTANQTITLTGAVTGSGTTSITTTLSALGATSSGQVLTWNGSAWAAAAPTGGVTGSGVTNRVAFWNGTSTLTSDADFNFDGNKVWVGTGTPSVSHLAKFNLTPSGGGNGIHELIRINDPTGWASGELIGWENNGIVRGIGLYSASGTIPVLFTRLQGSGRVGVNTNNPSAALDVVNTSEAIRASFDATYFANFSARSDGDGVFRSVTGNFSFGLSSEAISSLDATARMTLYAPSGVGETEMIRLEKAGGFAWTTFNQYYSTGGSDYGLRISSFGNSTYFSGINGNVGIGISPTEKLHVLGNILLTGVIKNADGSASATAYGFSNDLDIGMYRKGVNQLGFSTNGIERFSLGASGEIYFSSSAGTSGQILQSNGTASAPTWVTSPFPTGTGTANVLPIWTGSNTLGNSLITVSGNIYSLPFNNAGSASWRVSNTHSAAASSVFTEVQTDAGVYLRQTMYNSLSPSSGLTAAHRGIFEASGSGGFVIAASHSSGKLILASGGIGGANGRVYIHEDGLISIGTSVNNAIDRLQITGTSFFSSTVKIADGTAAVPSLAFNNDQNTGFFRPGADIIGFTVGGIEEMRVDANGLLIGTAGVMGGALRLAGSTSGTVTLNTAAAAGTWTWTIPTGAGSSGQFLQTNGSGVTSWQTISGLLPSGTNGQTLRHNGTSWIASSVITNTGTNVDVLATTQWSLFVGGQGIYGVSNAITAQTADFIIINPLGAGLTAAGLTVYEDNDNPTPQRVRITTPTITSNYDQTFTPANGEIGVWLRTVPVAFDFPSTGASSFSELAVTLTGSVVGKPCIVGYSTNVQGEFSAYCATAGTITVRYSNTSLVTIDPASTTIEVHQKL